MRTKKQRFSGHGNSKSASLKANLLDLIHMGNEFMARESYAEAAKFYSKVIEKAPNNTVALSNLGAALVRQGRNSEAKEILEYALELNPQDFNSRINLGAIFQANRDYKGAINNALEAVSIDPTSALAFNNLGCSFSNVNLMNEALHAYETALQLDPLYLEAQLNYGMTLVELQKYKESLEIYEDLLTKIPEDRKGFKEVVKFYCSILYLKFGDLETGWDFYESGFNSLIPSNAARSPNRKFGYPQWRGEDLHGKRLLVWREQGLGDELRFSTCLPDLDKYGGSVTFECSKRLVSTYERSFPNFAVKSEVLNIVDGTHLTTESYDFHIPLGSLPKILRKSLSDFPKKNSFIAVDEAHRSDFKQRLSSYSNKKLVGICWRSGLLDPRRNREYTALTDWANILSLHGYKFINLQYGECENELLEIESKLGINIVRWNDLDLKNDLDRVFALISCLHCVISAPTAVETMSGCLGIPTIYLASDQSWVTLGATDGNYPWFPKTLVCERPMGGIAAEILELVPNALKEITSAC